MATGVAGSSFPTTVATGETMTAQQFADTGASVSGIKLGTMSLKAVAIDGTGGAAATPVSGTLKISATASSATPGAGQGVLAGDQYKDTTPLAWGSFSNGGSIVVTRSANCTSITRSSQGVVVVTLVNGAANNLAPVATMSGSTAGMVTATANTASSFTIRTFDSAGTLADRDASFIVFGG